MGPFLIIISSPGKSLTTSLTNKERKGSNITALIILNKVWALAICLGILDEVNDTKYENLFIKNRNKTTPPTLKNRWERATLFPVIELPMLAINVVKQVPMLLPKIRGIAASIPIIPWIDMAITIAVVALLLWIMAVKIAATAMPNKGLWEIFINKSKNGV